ncbi:MAG: hypothetical protein COS95_04935 [Ignavibacteriales bacterium CG07_land_8_20_14_0_80_59_12]|jgi:rubrerythrin|nr:MAG: hypothetical protein COS95_04935 [Ignavibacteriales bacterium CG07_land_8_20_14_0_80_59_12]
MSATVETRENIISILERAVQREIVSCAYYTEAADCACDPQVRSFLLQLAAMEEGHREQLVGRLGELRAQLEITGNINQMFQD